MIAVRAKEVSLKLGAESYSREDLEAAAGVLDAETAVFLKERSSGFEVILRRPEKTPRARLFSLAGSFLNEALSHAYRQKVVHFNRNTTQPFLAAVFKKGFPTVPPDPLERLEPQVKEDRARELEGLLEAARKME